MRLGGRVAEVKPSNTLKKPSPGTDMADQGNGESKSKPATFLLSGPRGCAVEYQEYHHFVRGFGSVCRLLPDHPEGDHFGYRFYRPAESTKAALLRDWTKVGLDLYSVLHSVTIPPSNRESEDTEPAVVL